MSDNRQINISSVQEFLKNLDLKPIETPQPIYRGESGLFETACTPSLFRHKRNIPFNAWEQISGYLFEKSRIDKWFDEVTLLEFRQPYNTKSDIEKMVLAQHYGIITRLLDWTKNPLIALWFACKEFDNPTTKYENFAVYEFIPDEYFLEDDGSNEFLQFDEDRTLAYRNPYCLLNPNVEGTVPFKKVHFIEPITFLDNRIHRQSSVLSIHPDSEQKVNPLNTYIIDIRCTEKIMYELNILGINLNTVGLATRESIAYNVNYSFYKNL